MRRARIFAQFGLLHRFALERRGYRRIHHQLGQVPSGIVQFADLCANGAVVLGILHHQQLLLECADASALLRRELGPGVAAPAFLQGSQNSAGFIARFDHLARAKILFGVVE